VTRSYEDGSTVILVALASRRCERAHTCMVITTRTPARNHWLSPSFPCSNRPTYFTRASCLHSIALSLFATLARVHSRSRSLALSLSLSLSLSRLFSLSLSLSLFLSPSVSCSLALTRSLLLFLARAHSPSQFLSRSISHLLAHALAPALHPSCSLALLLSRACARARTLTLFRSHALSPSLISLFQTLLSFLSDSPPWLFFSPPLF